MSAPALNTALFHMAKATVNGHSPSNPLPTMLPCMYCKTTACTEISYRLNSKRWVIWCTSGCSDSGERKTLRAALMNWNKANRT